MKPLRYNFQNGPKRTSPTVCCTFIRSNVLEMDNFKIKISEETKMQQEENRR